MFLLTNYPITHIYIVIILPMWTTNLSIWGRFLDVNITHPEKIPGLDPYKKEQFKLKKIYYVHSIKKVYKYCSLWNIIAYKSHILMSQLQINNTIK